MCAGCVRVRMDGSGVLRLALATLSPCLSSSWHAVLVPCSPALQHPHRCIRMTGDDAGRRRWVVATTQTPLGSRADATTLFSL